LKKRHQIKRDLSVIFDLAMSAQLLECFWNLASLKSEVREKATLVLTEALCESERQFHANNHSKKKVASTEDAFSPDLIYSLKRLIRGLSSPRDGARQGFATALTEVLNMMLKDDRPIAVTLLLQWLNSATEITTSIKSREERDMYFGFLFGIMALEQSGILLHMGCTTMEDLQTIVERLVKISSKKSYFREIVFEIIVQLLKCLRKREFRHIVEYTLVPILTAEDIYSPEILVLVIYMEQMFPELPWNTILLKSGLQSCIVSEKNLAKIAEIMKETTKVHPRMHTSWKHMLACIPKFISVKEFWTLVVETTLFDASSSLEKKYLGMQLFGKISLKASMDEIESLFTLNFNRTLMNCLEAEKNDLYSCARHALLSLSAICQSRQELALPLAIQLLQFHNERNFGKLIKLGAIDSLVKCMTVESASKFIDHLKHMFYDSIENHPKYV
jgi:DNA polymerase phi